MKSEERELRVFLKPALDRKMPTAKSETESLWWQLIPFLPS